jgi:DNA-directed RNA polymerase
LQLVAITAGKEGIDLATVHDCFGCLAPRAARSKAIIADQYEHLHDRDLLEEVLQSAGADLPKNTILPDKPERGTLKLEGIRNSNAFR